MNISFEKIQKVLINLNDFWANKSVLVDYSGWLTFSELLNILENLKYHPRIFYAGRIYIAIRP